MRLDEIYKGCEEDVNNIVTSLQKIKTAGNERARESAELCIGFIQYVRTVELIEAPKQLKIFCMHIEEVNEGVKTFPVELLQQAQEILSKLEKITPVKEKYESETFSQVESLPSLDSAQIKEQLLMVITMFREQLLQHEIPANLLTYVETIFSIEQEELPLSYYNLGLFSILKNSIKVKELEALYTTISELNAKLPNPISRTAVTDAAELKRQEEALRALGAFDKVALKFPSGFINVSNDLLAEYDLLDAGRSADNGEDEQGVEMQQFLMESLQGERWQTSISAINQSEQRFTLFSENSEQPTTTTTSSYNAKGEYDDELPPLEDAPLNKAISKPSI